MMPVILPRLAARLAARLLLLPLALLLAHSAPARAEIPHRRLLFLGGPTLAAWAARVPDLCAADGAVRCVITPSGTASSLRAALAQPGPFRPDAVLILPQSGLGGESLARSEDDLSAMTRSVRAAGAALVLAAPLHFGPAPAPTSDLALTKFLRTLARAEGAAFADFHHAGLGPPPPGPPPGLAGPADLVARTTLLRLALDSAFRARPGQTSAQSLAALRAAHNAIPTPPGSGPYPAILATEPDLDRHVFYRPANLAPFTGSARLPVVIFGNGGCMADAAEARLVLARIASHGYLVIAPGAILSGPGATLSSAAPPSLIPTTRLADLTAALDWASAPPGPWARFIDPTRIAAAGWSCGGLQALKLAEDRRIRTSIIFDSGIFNTPDISVPGLPIAKSDLDALRGPVLYLLGGPTDMAYDNGSDDFRRITRVASFLLTRPVGHSGGFWQEDGRAWAHAATAWLDWQLRANPTARAAFLGPACFFCTAPGWTLRRKGP